MGKMFFHFILLTLSFMTFLNVCCGSSHGFDCATRESVLTPSRLVVKYGDPASATCEVCQPQDPQGSTFSFEKQLGDVVRNETTAIWKVQEMNRWDLTTMCYYEINGKQELITLPVIVYQPPQDVFFSFVNYTEPMTECREYTLQCSVFNVAPAEHLTVTFYRGETPLDHQRSSSRDKKPVSETFSLSHNISKEDDGVEFWCEAKLELGPEGPQRPPLVRSGRFTAAVLYSNCTDKFSFNSSSLVVKFGGPASATCVDHNDVCLHSKFDLEKSLGTVNRTGNTLLWRVNETTDWDVKLICSYKLYNNICNRTLPVTVYQPPQDVSFSFMNYTGSMTECREYTLQCSVFNVAPAEHLTVTFYRGETPLDHQRSSSRDKSPVTETFSLSHNISKEDDGVEFWCEAKLELGPEGPQRPPVVRSGRFTAAVLCATQSPGPNSGTTTVSRHTFTVSLMLLVSVLVGV